MLLLLQVPNVPGLSPFWQAVLVLGVIVATTIAAYERRWKTVAEAYEKEVTAVRLRADRVEGENKENATTIAELKGKTDITRIQDQNLRIVEELSKLANLVNERHMKTTELMSSNVGSIDSLSRHVVEQFGAQSAVLAGVAATLEAMEGRLSVALSLPLGMSSPQKPGRTSRQSSP